MIIILKEVVSDNVAASYSQSLVSKLRTLNLKGNFFTNYFKKKIMTYKFIDPEDEDFDATNPEIKVDGYGRYKRQELRKIVKGMATSLYNNIKSYTGSDEAKYDIVKDVALNLDPAGKIVAFIRADIGSMEELEKLRQKGGQRKSVIPKHD